MRWDEAFLSTFAPAAQAAQQNVYAGDRQQKQLDDAMSEREQRQKQFDAEMARRDKVQQDAVTARAETNTRLDEELRRRSRDNAERNRIADDSVKAGAQKDTMEMRMKQDALDAALFDKQVQTIAQNLQGVDEATMAAIGTPILKKQAAGQPLSMDERAALRAGELEIARRRGPQTEKVFENMYQLDAGGKPVMGDDGKPFLLGRKEFVQPRPKPALASSTGVVTGLSAALPGQDMTPFGGGGGAPAMSAEDTTAMQWAKTNAADPRASGILQGIAKRYGK